MKKIRTQIIIIGICIGKNFLNVIYFFVKICPTKNKIVMLSRQANKPSIDFELIQKELIRRTNNLEVKILCKVLKKDIKERIKYCFYILQCMYHIATAKVCILDSYSIPISILNHKKKPVMDRFLKTISVFLIFRCPGRTGPWCRGRSESR